MAGFQPSTNGRFWMSTEGNEDSAKALGKRALTNLYNPRPQWLVEAHAALDTAVAAAYGWSADISDDEVLRELLALNGGGQ